MIEKMIWWNFADALPAGYAIPSSDLILSLLLTPAIAGLLITLLRKKRVAEMITAVSASLVLIQTLNLIADVISKKEISGFGNLFYLDALGALIMLPIAGVGFVAALYSINYMGRQYERGIVDDKHIIRYYQLFNAFVLTMLLVPVSNNMGLMWVALESTTLVSVLLIMLYTNAGAIEAAWKYLVIATVGLSLALFGIVLFSYADTAVSISSGTGSTPNLNWTDMIARVDS